MEVINKLIAIDSQNMFSYGADFYFNQEYIIDEKIEELRGKTDERSFKLWKSRVEIIKNRSYLLWLISPKPFMEWKELERLLNEKGNKYNFEKKKSISEWITLFIKDIDQLKQFYEKEIARHFTAPRELIMIDKIEEFKGHITKSQNSKIISANETINGCLSIINDYFKEISYEEYIIESTDRNNKVKECIENTFGKNEKEDEETIED